MVGTWTPPGAIFTFAFNDETLSLELVKRTEIPHDEPISWMTFDVRLERSISAEDSKGEKEV
jgi:carboxy-cis,cis-muconate cyclase